MTGSNTSVSVPLAPRPEEIPSPDQCMQNIFHDGGHAPIRTVHVAVGCPQHAGMVTCPLFFHGLFLVFIRIFPEPLDRSVCVCV